MLEYSTFVEEKREGKAALPSPAPRRPPLPGTVAWTLKARLAGCRRYFNDKWNRTWTHGIPHHDVEHDGEIGPRMSVALLCTEGNLDTLKQLMKTKKNAGGMIEF